MATPPDGTAPVPISTWQTLARVAFEAGERTLAVEALNRILERCAAISAPDADPDFDAELSWPFLAVSPRFDEIAPPDGTGELLRWVTAAALEQREHLRALSSFYVARDPVTRACLEKIARLGYQSAEMARRLELIRRAGG